MNQDLNRKVVVSFDMAVYRLTAIKKAIYKFAGRCIVNLEVTTEHKACLTIDAANSTENLQDLVREIHCEVTDQELREVVLEETAPIRNLLLAQAFSATSLFESDAPTVDSLDDPKPIRVPDDLPHH